VRRALSETSSRACLDASTDTIPGATTDGLVSDGSYPSIACIASARVVHQLARSAVEVKARFRLGHHVIAEGGRTLGGTHKLPRSGPLSLHR